MPIVKSPLFIAAEKGQLQTVDTYLKQGDDPNERSSTIDLCTPVMAAANNGHIRVVERLIDAKANLNFLTTKGCTALDFALSENHLEVVRLLLRRVANVQIGKASGYLWDSSISGNIDLFHTLYAFGEKRTDDVIHYLSPNTPSDTNRRMLERMMQPLSLKHLAFHTLRNTMTRYDRDPQAAIGHLPLPPEIKDFCHSPFSEWQ